MVFRSSTCCLFVIWGDQGCPILLILRHFYSSFLMIISIVGFYLLHVIGVTTGGHDDSCNIMSGEVSQE